MTIQRNKGFFMYFPLIKRHVAALAILLMFGFASLQLQAQSVDAKQHPAEFVKAVTTQTLEVVKKDKAAQAGDRTAIESLVDQYVLPYVNFEKTTRLATGRYWRNASEKQRSDLVDAFKGTLIRTYSGSLDKVDNLSAINVGPFRGEPSADDVVVRTTITQKSGPEVTVDYRMENTPKGWRIYDINVEGIWLIQNYRNQFAQVINQQGFDGLIKTLQNQTMTAEQNT